MAKCNHCGHGLNPGQRICPKCYRDVLAETKAPEFDPMQVAKRKPQTPKQPAGSVTIRKAAKRMAVIALLFFLVIMGMTVFNIVRTILSNFRSILDPPPPPPATQDQQTTDDSNVLTVAEILRVFQEGEADAKTQACYTAGQLSPFPPELIQPITERINDPVTTTSCACAWAIGNAGEAGTPALPQLLQLMKSDSPCKSAAVESAAKIGASTGNSEVRSALAAALTDPDMNVRRSAAASLKEYGNTASDAIPALIAASSDDSSDVRHTVVMTLGGFSQTASAEIVSALISRLKDREGHIRAAAAEALAAIGPAARDAIPALAGMIQDHDEYAAAQAVNALGAIGKTSGETVPHLITGLQHPNDSVRKYAVLHLGEMGPLASAAVPALIPILSGEEIYLRVWAAEALGNIGPAAKAAVPRLKQMQQEKIVSNEMEAAQLPQTVAVALKKIEGR